MIREFGHFHPKISRIVQYVLLKYKLISCTYSEHRKAPDVTRWPLFIHSPLSKWSRGKILLIGDAAHPVCLSLLQ